MIVNRVWQYHFGRGLVATVERLRPARRAAQPPRAARLAGRPVRRARAGALKPLHRLILTSATYRQAAGTRAARGRAADRPREPLALADGHPPARRRADPRRDAGRQRRARRRDRRAERRAATEPRRTIYTKVIRNSPRPAARRLRRPRRLRQHRPARRDDDADPGPLADQRRLDARPRRGARRPARSRRPRHRPSRALVDRAYRLAFGRPPDRARGATRPLRFLRDAAVADRRPRTAAGTPAASEQAADRLLPCPAELRTNSSTSIESMIQTEPADAEAGRCATEIRPCARSPTRRSARARDMLLRGRRRASAPWPWPGCSGRDRARRRPDRPSPLGPRPPHVPARAKSVIFLFMEGGPSHIDMFDPKPLLNQLGGQAAARRASSR